MAPRLRRGIATFLKTTFPLLKGGNYRHVCSPTEIGKTLRAVHDLDVENPCMLGADAVRQRTALVESKLLADRFAEETRPIYLTHTGSRAQCSSQVAATSL